MLTAESVEKSCCIEAISVENPKLLYAVIYDDLNVKKKVP
jgi:hypothetical protein